MTGDIGGTNSRLAVVEGGKVTSSRWYPSRGFKGLHEVLERFREDLGGDLPGDACFAVAGVVEGQRVQATNIPWEIDAVELKARLGLRRVLLLNDFEAAAWGVPALGPQDLVQIGGGLPDPEGPRAILGAGTGLGEAVLVPCPDKGLHVLATEGGHADFAPVTREQAGLLAYLQREMDHVSVEQVLSGPGLVNIYNYISSKGKTAPEHLSPEEISKRALSRPRGPEARALRLFVEVYGAEAGNLALKCLARGGVYVAGGIAPGILPAMEQWGFRRFFEAKGRMQKVLEDIPTWVVVNRDLGLIGAAHLMARLKG